MALHNDVLNAFRKNFNNRLVRITLKSKLVDPSSPALKFSIDPERIALTKTSGTPLEISYSLRNESGFLNNAPMGPKEKKWFSDAFDKIMDMLEKDKLAVEVEDLSK